MKDQLEKAAGHQAKTATQPERVELSRAEIDLLMEPWQRDFTLLGFKNLTRPDDSNSESNAHRARTLSLIDDALGICRTAKSNLRGLNWFCGDGFYGLYALMHGAESIVGVDTDNRELSRARTAARILGQEEKTSFDQVDSDKTFSEFDFCLCTGLHKSNRPEQLLGRLAQIVRGPLVIETETSASESLHHTLSETGWSIIKLGSASLKSKKRGDQNITWVLCVPPQYIESGFAKPAGSKDTENKNGLWDEPNRFARPFGIQLGSTITVKGYQEFQIHGGKVIPLETDPPLRRKQKLATPYFDPKFLAGKSLLDIGANGGFFSFWACDAGAAQVVSLDMDENYLAMIRKAQTHLGLKQIRPVNCRAQDWEESADLVIAFAMIHWLYSCTANFGSLDGAVAKLASLTNQVLLIEWVAPEDSAIKFFKHTEWNAAQAQGPYTVEAFEAALRKHFYKVEIVGETSATRTLYAACHQRAGVDLSEELPLVAPANRILHSRCLINFKGVNLYSRIYSTDKSNELLKQATGDLAMHEAELLKQLSGPHFPRVISAEQQGNYSTVTLERIAGGDLADELPKVCAHPKDAAALMRECLEILGELSAAKIEHRDIRLDNFVARNGHPVLLDFGWGQQEGKPYMTPRHLGAMERIPTGPTSDVYSMGKVFEQLVPDGSKIFAPLIQLMANPGLARTLPLPTLMQVLNNLEVPGKWDVKPVFSALKPKVAPEGSSSLVPGLKPPYLQRTFRRWKRSIKKRIGPRKA